jgi:hypothetical protein
MPKKKKDFSELDPGSTAWMNALTAMSPQEQAALFGGGQPDVYNFDDSVTGTAEQPGGFADYGDESGIGLAGTGYTLPPGFEGLSMDPQTQGMLQFGGGVNIPTLSAKGVLEPYDLPQEAARVNLMQDNATSIADVILASLAGPGAIDPSSFAPVVTPPTERIKTPGLAQLDRYAQGGGYQGYIARKIRDEHMTDAEATAALYNYIATPESDQVTDEDRRTKQTIIDSMQSAFGSGDQVKVPNMFDTGLADRPSQEVRNTYDEPQIAKFAYDLFTKSSDDLAATEAGYQDPKTGYWYSDAPVSEDSPLMQKFRNLGLPSPFEQYNSPDRLQSMYDQVAPTLGADVQNQQQNVVDLQAIQDQLLKESQAASGRNIDAMRLMRENYRPAGYQNAPTTPPVGPAPPSQVQASPFGGAGDVVGGVLMGGNPGRGAAGALRAQGIGGDGQGGFLSGLLGSNATAGAIPTKNQGGAWSNRPTPPPPLANNLGGTPPGDIYGGDWQSTVGGQILPASRAPSAAPGKNLGGPGAVPPPFSLPMLPTNSLNQGALPGSTWRPEGTKQNIQGIENPAGGYDFMPGQNVDQRAMANAVLNFFGAMPFGGGAKRGEKVVTLNADTAKRSQKAADEARKKFTNTNTARYQATQNATPGMNAAAYALGQANTQSKSTTPFQDVIMQRLLGQRAVGVRGL